MAGTGRRSSVGNDGRRVSLSTSESMTEVMYTTPVWDPFAPVGQADEIFYGPITRGLLPVAAVASVIALLYLEYVFLHCFRLLQYDLPSEQRVAADADRGSSEMFTFHIFTGLVVYCFYMCITTKPGAIPDSPEWINQGETVAPVGGVENPAGERRGSVSILEAKQTGVRRSCKWCFKYKPDRCHHCKICKTCVLRMDHHCPWVNNCIGFCNHKYFFLLIVYAVVDLGLVSFLMFDTVWWSTRVDVSIFIMLVLILGETLATFLLVLTGSFLAFHVWLMLKAMTTLEFCEKKLKNASYDSSSYCRSPHANVCAVLGPNPLLWLLPLGLPLGDGIDWSVDSTGFAQRQQQAAGEQRARKSLKKRASASGPCPGAAGSAGSPEAPEAAAAPVFRGVDAGANEGTASSA